MGLYEDLRKNDLLTPVNKAIRTGDAKLTDERIVVSEKLVEEMSWIIHKLAEDRQCTRHHTVYAKQYGFIPWNCHYCFKVVARPKTLRDLFKIREIQKKLGLPSKCGIEERRHVPALYGAYWYCPIGEGLKGARALHATVNAEVESHLAPGTPVILKRGCTEMELTFGPSDRWVYSKADEARERQLDEIYDVRRRERVLPPYLEDRVLIRWIEWAYAHGDETYLDYTDGPLTRPVVTYHGSRHRDEDFPGKP